MYVKVEGNAYIWPEFSCSKWDGVLDGSVDIAVGSSKGAVSAGLPEIYVCTYIIIRSLCSKVYLHMMQKYH